MEFDKLKTFLMESTFTDKQFREIKAIADIKLGNFSSREASLKELEQGSSLVYTQAFYNQLRDYLQTHCKISTTPLSILKTTTPKTFNDVVAAANFLYAVADEWNTDRTMQRNFVVGVYYLYIKLAVSYLRECKVPVAVKTVLQHTDKFVGLVDNSWPGYIESGIVKVIILGPDLITRFRSDE